MGTDIRPEISRKKKYWIDRHRYYELKHFCLQYSIWRKTLQYLDGMGKCPLETEIYVKDLNLSDPTHECAAARELFADRINMIDQAAHNADPDLGCYILIGVTQGITYEGLLMKYGIPCCRETYYDRYRKFFWILNKARK